ncbi:type IV toxin-antitoxin system AbiEi family antitoxin domain-containing protein [Nocardioides sp. AX2bis]|uniref:type IV toxin-antitoxin system AbiEi family antitoxin domain-containing protein n=1 Tax=Nocardioides sp. AX2bis TaxID=2653157 RepID=UPI0012F18D69|nr:type IV toxin-antitoxin system AbiEi family antitoxin domain-containing protein [Nocardioides sp. AX2bis]VXB55122.1 conserved hypothetical protein [Nocardioides sp. AX2bis]
MTVDDRNQLLLSPVHLRRDLVARGWTDEMLADAVRQGVLSRPRRGAYVDGPTWHALDELGRHELTARAAVAQAGRAVVVSHASALVSHGAPRWGLPLDAVHLTSRDGIGGRVESGIRRHRGTLLEGDVVDVRGLAVTSPSRALLELATTCSTEVALVHVNDLLHRGLTTISALRDRYEGAMERWPRSRATDLVLRLADHRCESVAESRFFFLCWRCGLPAPEPQYKVYDSRGRLVAILDFAWPKLGVFAEIDGKGKYLELRRKDESIEDAVLREKGRENLVRRLTGMRGLRFDWADLERPQATARVVREELFPEGVSA